jgi:hypothetical protein
VVRKIGSTGGFFCFFHARFVSLIKTFILYSLADIRDQGDRLQVCTFIITEVGWPGTTVTSTPTTNLNNVERI